MAKSTEEQLLEIRKHLVTLADEVTRLRHSLQIVQVALALQHFPDNVPAFVQVLQQVAEKSASEELAATESRIQEILSALAHIRKHGDPPEA